MGKSMEFVNIPDRRKKNFLRRRRGAHSAGVVLRNVNPEGVQVRQRGPDSEWAVWLADLHCAAPIKEGAEDECMAGMHGTPEYCAPEVVIWYWHEQGQLAEPPPRCQAG